MGIEVSREDHNILAVVQDEMTIYTALEQREQLLPLLGQCQQLELDLSAVAEMDSAGIQLLLLLKQEAERLQKPLLLKQPSELCKSLIELLRLEARLELTSDPSEGRSSGGTSEVPA